MAIITVTSTADIGSGSLRQAIADAASGDTIEFDAATFPINTETSIALDSNIQFPTKDLIIDGADTWTDNGSLKTRVVLDRQGAGRVLYFPNSGTVEINGVTAANGYVSSSSSSGGAYFIGSQSVTFNYCVFKNCAGAYGGSLNILGTSSVTLNNCLINSSSSTSWGGAVLAGSSTQNAFNNCLFKNCSSNSGGAIFSNSTSKSVINNCTFDTCSADNGGGVYSYSTSSIILNNSAFNNCSATGSGNAIFVYNTSQTTINNCTFTTPTTNTKPTIYNGGTNADGSLILNGSMTCNRVLYASNTTSIINGKLTADVLTISNGASVTFTDEADLVVTNSATLGTATFSAASGDSATATFPAGTSLSSATWTNVATTLVVQDTSDSGTNSLRNALTNSVSGTTITFDDALEEGGVITVYIESRLYIGSDKSLIIDGEGNWTEGGTLKTRVVLDGQNTYALMQFASTGTLELNDLTFKNASETGNGAAITSSSNTYGNLTINNCVFDTCSATQNGGALFRSTNNDTTLTNCLFITCSASNGGAIRIGGGGNFTLNNCVFNVCSGTTYGGGIRFGTSGQNVLNNCRFINCTGDGSAFFVESASSDVTVNNCDFGTTSSAWNIYNSSTVGTLILQGTNTVDKFSTANNSTVTFSGVDAVLAVTTTATIGSATFTAAEGATGYAAFPAGTDTSAATFTGVKTATYSTSTPTVSASIGETRTATVTIANVEAGYITEIVYADGVVADITIDDGSAVIPVDKAFKIRVFNGAFYESATVARTYYLKTYDADGDFATSTDWTLDAGKTLTCNAAPTISGGVFYCTEPAPAEG